jgi:YesN/AraC family two-component response regulator
VNHPLKVLCLDDEETLVTGIASTLSHPKRGYNVFYETNGHKAIETYKNESPDICVLDINLNDASINGIDVLREIHSLNQDTLCIMYTKMSEDANVRQANEYGVFHFLAKPVKREELIDTVNKAAEFIRKRGV